MWAAEEWFCSKECTGINEGLRKALEAGEVDLGGGSSWRLLHGSKARPQDSEFLETARTILQTSFDPIIDKVSGKDLLEAMVFAQDEVGDWDFRGMHTALLFHEVLPRRTSPCLFMTCVPLELRGFCKPGESSTQPDLCCEHVNFCPGLSFI